MPAALSLLIVEVAVDRCDGKDHWLQASTVSERQEWAQSCPSGPFNSYSLKPREELTAQIGCSPIYTHVVVTAGLSVRCHGRAEAEELALKLAGAGLLHTCMVVGLWIHLGIQEHCEQSSFWGILHDKCISYHQVAVSEGFSRQDHTAALGPGRAVGVPLTWKHLGGHIRAGRCGGFPTVAKNQGPGKHWEWVLA